ADAQRARKMRQSVSSELTVARMIQAYQKSRKFEKLAESSKRNYSIYLEVIRDQIGPAPANLIDLETANTFLEKMGDRPSAANMAVRTLGALYEWGRKAKLVTAKPTHGVEYLPEGEH